FTRPTVSISPVRALWTRLPFRVVTTFLVWTPNDAVGKNDGFRAMFLDEIENLLPDACAVTYVFLLTPPPLYNVGPGALARHNADRHLRSCIGCRTVERDRRDRGPSKTFPRLFQEQRLPLDPLPCS